MQTVVKKWFRDKGFGFLDNGGGPDIFVYKADLQNCQFLRVGVTVEFECFPEKRGLVAKSVKLVNQRGGNGGNGGNRGNGNSQQGSYGNSNGNRQPFIGVMT